MKKLIKPTRIFLGLFFTIFGLNGLVMIMTGNGFIPMPPPAEQFAPIMMSLFGAKFVMPIAKLIQFSAGLMLLSNKYTNLALVLLAPVLVSILAAHLVVMDLAGIPFGVIALIAWLILAIDKKEIFKPFFNQ